MQEAIRGERARGRLRRADTTARRKDSKSKRGVARSRAHATTRSSQRRASMWPEARRTAG
eukprot:scaffold15394_cov111-Isochrysis_galbana.AAC.12